MAEIPTDPPSPGQSQPDDEQEDTVVNRFCVVGLGNPGARYDFTPHNIGFAVVDTLAARHEATRWRNEGVALTGTCMIGSKDVTLVKPTTFMNNSGPAVKAMLRMRNLEAKDLILVHDELDLAWTGLRIRKRGSAAGHNGVKSVISALGSDYFTRVRVGIRPDNLTSDPALYVLAPWSKAMKEHVSDMVSYTADAVETIVAEGAVKAMTSFNRRAQGLKEEEE